jgi:hypothetical protein
MGKISGSGCDVLIPIDDRAPIQDIERSLITKYKWPIWAKFLTAINDFQLIEDDDKIALQFRRERQYLDG